METISITVENIKKAHAEGCSDVRKTLELIAPDVFKTKFPCFAKGNNSHAIYLFLGEETSIRLTDGDDADWHKKSIIGKQTDRVKLSSCTPIKGISAL